MPRRKFPHFGISLVGRPQTAPRQTWRKQEWIKDEFHPQGILADVTPMPGHTYTRETWPPRGRGRGESLSSPRRIDAKLRQAQVIRLRLAGFTWKAIARALGFSDGSGPYRAYRRAMDRMQWDRDRKAELRRYACR